MKKILVVDDEDQMSKIMERYLKYFDYDVIGRAPSGEDAIKIIKNNKPDIVLMDIVMPGNMDGIETAQIIKDEFDIPVIFVTGYADDKYLQRAKYAEPYGYILKPFKEEELNAVIEIAFHKKKTEREFRKAEKRIIQDKSICLNERKTILVVDDDNVILQTLMAILMIDYNVIMSTNGAEAINLAQLKSPDLIILDVMMPDMDGYKVCTELKKNQETKDIPVIFLTCMSDKGDETTGLELGAVDYIYKPFHISNLRKRIKNQIKNITQAKQLQEKVKELESFRMAVNIIESMIDGVSLFDGNGFIKYVNNSFIEMYGYKFKEELIGKPLLRLFRSQTTLRNIDFFSLKRKIQNIEVTSIKKNGQLFPSLINLSTLLDDKGGVVGDIIAVRDIAELKLMEKELELKKSQLFHSSKLASLGEMATGLAHEINQPLGAISLVAKYFSKINETGKMTKDLLEEGIADINAAVVRISKLINHIRSFAKQGTTRLHDRANINQTIDNALIFCNESFGFHNIEIVKEFFLDLPEISCDPMQLEQVWLNFINNAKDAVEEKEKYFADKKVKIENYKKSLRIITNYEKGSNNVEVIFKDNGIGISEDIKNKVFEPFFTTKEVGEGTGIGLSISFGIIKNHKGKIEMDSEMGVGTTFKIILPVTQS